MVSVKMNTILALPEKLNFSNKNEVGKTWKKFKKAWTHYELASGLVEKGENVKVSTFLHIAGDEAIEKYEGFLWNNPEDKYSLEKIFEKFDEDYNENTNFIMERYKFLHRKQAAEETCDQFATALRSLVTTCNYDKPQDALRDQFLLNLYSEKAKEKILDEAQRDARSLTFEKAISIVKINEQKESQKRVATEINMIKKPPGSSKAKHECGRCLRNHKPYECPAYGRTCSKCKKPNHFAAACRGKAQVKLVEDCKNESNVDQEEL